MTYKPESEISPLLHPYMFVLKAGNDIKNDLMDFSLSIWYLNCQEHLPRPKNVPVPASKTKTCVK